MLTKIREKLIGKRPCLSLLILVITSLSFNANAGQSITDLPVRAFKIGSPKPKDVDTFIHFIEHDLAKTPVNQLFLRINYNFKFKSHPELADKAALSEAQVKRIVKAANKHGIEVIPLVNLLGHQSWKQDNIKSLLRVYPEFEENPGPKLHDDDFYTRAYCPNHPEVHDVVFALVDEIADAFDAKAVHAGMDEVFILGEDGCPRCKGKNKAELFANEVNLIQQHLAKSNRKMYIWGDRLLDGETTGIGKWAAAINGTHPAIDLISKDVIIVDWQYRKATPTPGYFALKGFNVISASYQFPEVAEKQVNRMLVNREFNNDKIKDRLNGVMHTYWGGFKDFYSCYIGKKCANEAKADAVATFKHLFENAKPSATASR